MTTESRNLPRVIHNAMYTLKRLYGGPIAIYRRVGGSTNRETGIVAVEKEVYNVDRAIILPAKVSRHADQPLSVISANKSFVYGGTYDRNVRRIIVDRRDVPELDLQTFELTMDDWVVYDSKKYEVKQFEILDFDAGWAIIGEAVEGDVPEQIHNVCADNLMRLDSVSAES